MRNATLEGRLSAAPLDRRAALAAMVAAGYAAAAASAEAAPIVTPADGLAIEEGRIPGPGPDGAAMPFYLARPAEGGARPAILVVNEVFGVHEHIRDLCRRLAHAGYVAMAPDYFFRAGDAAAATEMPAVAALVAATPIPQVLADTEAALAALAARADVDAGRMGVTGFCWGGTIVWLTAALSDRVRAGVAWYGRLTARQPGDFGYAGPAPSPVDLAGQLRAPVLGLYAGVDPGIPAETVAAMRAGLAAAGNPTGSMIEVFAQAQHGFNADYRATYNAAAAAKGWAMMLDWFRTRGVA